MEVLTVDTGPGAAGPAAATIEPTMTTKQATPVRIGLIGAGAIMRLSHARR